MGHKKNKREHNTRDPDTGEHRRIPRKECRNEQEKNGQDAGHKTHQRAQSLSPRKKHEERCEQYPKPHEHPSAVRILKCVVLIAIDGDDVVNKNHIPLLEHRQIIIKYHYLSLLFS